MTAAPSKEARSRASAGSDAEPTLGERAAAAARAELRGDRQGILGAVGPVRLSSLIRARRAPEYWSLLRLLSHFQG